MSSVQQTATTGTEPPSEPPLRVMALHALLYCERLFYLEEVEEIRVANARVYAGRRLHEEVAGLDDETPEKRSLEVAGEGWGLLGKVDAVRRRDGAWVVYEHKRGRSRRDERNQPQAWPSDRIQAIAYAVLAAEEFGEPVPQARVRYHRDNATAFVQIDEQARDDLRRAIERARRLRRSTERPAVTDNESLCKSCSLAVVCLPEEERLAAAETETGKTLTLPPAKPTLFPSNRERHTLHVAAQKAYVTRRKDTLRVKTDDGEQSVPIRQIDALVVHGHGQVTTQALHLCAYHQVAVQWMTAGGKFVAGMASSPGRVQQRIRQYRGLAREELCRELARRTVHAKVESQLKYLLRGTRGNENRRSIQPHIDRIRESLRKTAAADSLDALRGLEGMAAKAYFAAIPTLLSANVDDRLRPAGRTKHPPKDCFNALLSFGYGMLFGLVHRALLAVGLEPALGYFHQPRSAAPPLVMDVMEIFRVPLVDMPVVASVNRGQWKPNDDFTFAGSHVWLSDAGRRQAIALFEQRLNESYKHPYTGQSLCYARIVELEVRLLEKEWTGSPGLFAQLRLR
jgi:CRISPR-associated protein Cas1